MSSFYSENNKVFLPNFHVSEEVKGSCLAALLTVKANSVVCYPKRKTMEMINNVVLLFSANNEETP